MADRDNMGNHSGKLVLDDNSIFDLSQLLKDSRIKNIDNDIVALKVESQTIESTYSNVFTTNESNTSIISADSGEQIIVTDVFVSANANLGEVSVDFDGGDPIARLYTTQFQRLALSNMSNKGGEGKDVVITGDASGSGDEIFITINYIKLSV